MLRYPLFVENYFLIQTEFLDINFEKKFCNNILTLLPS